MACARLETNVRWYMKVGIIGLGYVGGALQHWFEEHTSEEVFLYDKFKNIGSVDDVNGADVIFVAVPTPYHTDGRGYDDSAVIDAVSNVRPGKTIVIKSTVLPGTTARIQERRPENVLLFNPRFPSETILRKTGPENRSTIRHRGGLLLELRNLCMESFNYPGSD